LTAPLDLDGHVKTDDGINFQFAITSVYVHRF